MVSNLPNNQHGNRVEVTFGGTVCDARRTRRIVVVHSGQGFVFQFVGCLDWFGGRAGLRQLFSRASFLFSVCQSQRSQTSSPCTCAFWQPKSRWAWFTHSWVSTSFGLELRLKRQWRGLAIMWRPLAAASEA